MPLTKPEKQKIIESLKEKLTRQKAIVFADITGLKVKNLSSLRKELKKQSCELKVIKKTLISLVLKNQGFGVDLKQMKGEIALGFGYGDEITPFKLLYNFSKNNENLKIVAGLIGKDLFEKERVVALAQLPGRQQLLTTLVGSISAPLSGLLNVLQGNLKGLVLVLNAIKKGRNEARVTN